MGCCGERRAALRAQPSAPAPPPPRPRPTELDDAGGVALEYRGDAPILLRGTASGRLYTFSPTRRVRPVAGRDTEQLLENPLFQPASG